MRRKSRDEIRAEENFALLCYTWRVCLVSLAGPDVLPQFTRKKNPHSKKIYIFKAKKRKKVKRSSYLVPLSLFKGSVREGTSPVRPVLGEETETGGGAGGADAGG